MDECKTKIEQTIGPVLMHRDAYFTLQERVDKIEKVEDDYHKCVEVLDVVDQFAQEVEESLRQVALVKIKFRVTEKAKNILRRRAAPMTRSSCFAVSLSLPAMATSPRTASRPASTTCCSIGSLPVECWQSAQLLRTR